MTLFIVIPTDLPGPYAALAGEYVLYPYSKPGCFRARLPDGAPAEWLQFENAGAAAVLCFGSDESADDAVGQWAQTPGILAEYFSPDYVVHLPARKEGRQPATVELFVDWQHGPRLYDRYVQSCPPSG